MRLTVHRKGQRLSSQLVYSFYYKQCFAYFRNHSSYANFISIIRLMSQTITMCLEILTIYSKFPRDTL